MNATSGVVRALNKVNCPLLFINPAKDLYFPSGNKLVNLAVAVNGRGIAVVHSDSELAQCRVAVVSVALVGVPVNPTISLPPLVVKDVLSRSRNGATGWPLHLGIALKVRLFDLCLWPPVISKQLLAGNRCAAFNRDLSQVQLARVKLLRPALAQNPAPGFSR